jgi:hypothetical protein
LNHKGTNDTRKHEDNIKLHLFKWIQFRAGDIAPKTNANNALLCGLLGALGVLVVQGIIESLAKLGALALTLYDR